MDINMDPPSDPPASPSSNIPKHAPSNDGEFKSVGSFLRNIRELAVIANDKKRAATQKTIIGRATAFIDQDDSGNYDPKEEFRRKKTKRAARLVELSEDEDGNLKPKRKGRFDGMITLTLTSKKGLDYLRSITPGPFSESGEKTESESEDEDPNTGRKRRSRNAKKEPERIDGLTLDQLTIGHPQRQGCKACFLAGQDDCTLIDDGHDYPCEACEDAEIDCELIVPPKLKQDCERCKAKRLKCSYRRGKGKGKTSCTSCATEDLPCIAGPAKESTRRMDDVLSHTTPEREGMVAPRTPSPSPPPVRPRRFKSCNQCRNNSKTCSIRSFQDSGPCSSCRKADQNCQFVMIPPSQLEAFEEEMAERRSGITKKHEKLPTRSEPSKRARREESEAYSPDAHTHKLYSEVENRIVRRAKKLDAKGKRNISNPFLFDSGSFGIKSYSTNTFDSRIPQLIGYTAGNCHIFIDTHFCHPIRFNYEPYPENTKPCSWCEDPLFGIHGLGPLYHCDTKHVEGFYDPHGNGFEEIMGGFAELNATQTKMCISCTWGRIKILSCEIHTIRKITDEELNGWVYSWKKFEAAAVKWNEDENHEDARYFKEAKWCAICPNFASYKCASEVGEVHGDEGCGLLLCGDCKEVVDKVVKGGVFEGKKMLDTLVREIAVQKWQFDQGVRADASFLTTSGELCVRLDQGMGANDGVEDDDVSNRSKTASSEEFAQMKKLDRRLMRKTQRKQRELEDSESFSPVKDLKDNGKNMSYFGSATVVEVKGKGRAVSSLEDDIEVQRPAKTRKTRISSHTSLPDTRRRRASNNIQEPGGMSNLGNTHLERGGVKLGGIVKPRIEQVAQAFGESYIDLTGEE